MMREPSKQCISADCAQCNFYRPWILTNDRGEQKVENRCSFEMLFEEIPRIRGSVDGCQQASNEARNRVMEFGAACTQTLRAMAEALPAYIDHVNKQLLEG
jgi:hypothetical protein